MNYFTSDTHFNHVNIMTFCRPEFTDTDTMNWAIVKKWNSVVSPDDTVFHLGDFAFKTGQKKEETRNLAGHLNGSIRLYKGNHDNLKQIKDFPFERIVEEPSFMMIKGVKFKLSHYPYPWGQTDMDKSERPWCKTEPDLDPDTGKLYPLINGHVHSTWAVQKGCLNVGWDIFKRPVSEDEIFRIYEATKGFQELTGVGDILLDIIEK